MCCAVVLSDPQGLNIASLHSTRPSGPGPFNMPNMHPDNGLLFSAPPGKFCQVTNNNFFSKSQSNSKNLNFFKGAKIFLIKSLSQILFNI